MRLHLTQHDGFSIAAQAALMLAATLAIPGTTQAQSQQPKLAAVTTKDGQTLCEILSDTPEGLKVFDLKTGMDASFPRESIVQIRTQGVPNETDLGRLGRFPNNLASYLAWLAKRPGQGQGVGKVKNYAVLSFPNTKGVETAETSQRREELTGALARWEVPVVERAQLEKALGELGLQNTALFDPGSAARVGKQLGAGFVLIGSLTPKEKKADLNLRVVDVETGQIVAAPSLKDMEGLPDKRTPIFKREVVMVESLTGTWDVTTPNGATGMTRFNPGGGATRENATGRWSQDGVRFSVEWTPNDPAKKALKGHWNGRLEARGREFTATNDSGGTIRGRKR